LKKRKGGERNGNLILTFFRTKHRGRKTYVTKSFETVKWANKDMMVKNVLRKRKKTEGAQNAFLLGTMGRNHRELKTGQEGKLAASGAQSLERPLTGQMRRDRIQGLHLLLVLTPTRLLQITKNNGPHKEEVHERASAMRSPKMPKSNTE